MIADVVRSYVDLTVAQAQQDLLARHQAVDDRGEQLALVRQRLRLDEPGELERLRARQAATRAAIAQARENADNAARALALLLGRERPDPAWHAYRTPPTLGAFTLQQVPADLLRHRPQILLAESELMQAAASKGSARAAMYPRVSLGGSILYAYNLTQNARSNSDSSPSIGPYIDIPLWDWGQRRARFHADEKQLDAALLGYRKAVLGTDIPRLAVEAGRTDGWWKYVGLDGAVIGIDRFGESAPAEALFPFFGLTPGRVAETARALL